MVDAMEFVAVKSYKAKGKRLTTYAIESVAEIEPREVDDVDDEVSPDDIDADSDEANEPDRSDDEVRDEINGQKRIF